MTRVAWIQILAWIGDMTAGVVPLSAAAPPACSTKWTSKSRGVGRPACNTAERSTKEAAADQPYLARSKGIEVLSEALRVKQKAVQLAIQCGATGAGGQRQRSLHVKRNNAQRDSLA